ncbi:MAG: hypothetical protein ACHQM6_03915 [Candidatus Kapaibacterium sp.]
MAINEEPLHGTLFGNLKIPKLGKVDITFEDMSVVSKEINQLGTTVFESSGNLVPYKIKIYDKEYVFTDDPVKVDVGHGTSTTLYVISFKPDATLILFGFDYAAKPEDA